MAERYCLCPNFTHPVEIAQLLSVSAWIINIFLGLARLTTLARSTLAEQVQLTLALKEANYT